MARIDFDADSSDIIQTIQDSVETKVIDVPPGQFVTREVFAPPKPSLVEPVTVSSLTALVDYVNDVDEATAAPFFIIVENPHEVALVRQVKDREDRRHVVLRVEQDPRIRHGFGEFISQENAIIGLQTLYAPTPEREDLLEILGNMVADEEIQQEDDGVTQRVTIQAGIRRSAVKIENPVKLVPFRTFPEVAQPSSPFVIRTRKSGDLIQVAILEADGGQWRNTARQRIADYIRDKIGLDPGAVIA